MQVSTRPVSTCLNAVAPSRQDVRATAALFLLAAGATFTIPVRDPLASFAYCLGAFVLGAFLLLPKRLGVIPPIGPALKLSGFHSIPRFKAVLAAAMALIAVWGFAHTALGLSVYRYASVVGSLRVAAEVATLFSAWAALRDRGLRSRFLLGFVWLAFAISIIAVLSYYTSPGKILWGFTSPYPDTWGVFLSRNDFAMFMELSLPVALWGTQLAPWREKSGSASLPFRNRIPMRVPIWVPAWLLAAGFASASRAGAILLALEAATWWFWMEKPWRGESGRQIPAGRVGKSKQLVSFALLAGLLMAVAGVTALMGRLSDPQPWILRDQIAASAVSIIRDRPWTGFGIGTFRYVYPAYATFDAGLVVEHVHNEFLEWAAEGGIIYAGLWAAAAGAILVPAWRSGFGVGIIAVFLHSSVDYPFAKFGITAWTFALMGAIQAEGERTPSLRALTQYEMEGGSLACVCLKKRAKAGEGRGRGCE